MKHIFRHRLLTVSGPLLLMALLLTLVSCGDDKTSVSPTPSGALTFRQVTSVPNVTTWERIWGVSAADMFVMGEDGYVYRGDGFTWNQELATVENERIVYSAWGNAANNVFFVGLVDDGITEIVIDTADDGTIDTTILPVADKPILSQYNGIDFAEEVLDFQWGLYDIWGAAADDIYAVGYDGTIIHFDGTDWTTMFTGGEKPAWLNAVWGTSSTSVYASGSKGSLLHYDGTDWAVMNAHTDENLWDVWGFSDSSLYCVGSNGTILHYDGSNFDRMTTPVTKTLYSIWGNDENDLYAVGWSGTILHYDGSEWTEVESGTKFGFLSVWGTPGGPIYAVGQTSLRLDGNAWSPLTIRGEPDFRDVWAGLGATSAEVISVGTGGTVVTSAGGNFFDNMTVDGSTITTDLNGVGGTDADGALFVVGDDGTILARDEVDDDNWVSVASGTSGDLYAVAALSDTLAYAVGFSGALVELKGDTWTLIPLMTTEDLNDVWIGEANGDTVVHVVGGNGFTYIYDGSWHPTTSNTTANLRSVYGVSPDEAYAVGDNGTLLHYENGTWTVMSSGTSENLTSIWAADATHLFIAAESGRAFSFNGTSLTELETELGFDLNGIYGLSTTNVFAVGDFNHIIQYSY